MNKRRRWKAKHRRAGTNWRNTVITPDWVLRELRRALIRSPRLTWMPLQHAVMMPWVKPVFRVVS